MRLSQLSGKELIDIEKGRKLGVLGQTDLLFDEKTGLLKELIIPKSSWMGLKRKVLIHHVLRFHHKSGGGLH